jgi:hypothetical protein
VPTDPVGAWLSALDARHLADLKPAEVTRALRALSSCYVERRAKLARGAALDGAGKRAAFALFYGPQHLLIVRHVARALELAGSVRRVFDLGCGTGVAGAAVALEAPGAAIEGFDLNRWAVREANWTYQVLGVDGRATITNISKVRMHSAPGALVLAAYAVNEIPDESRDRLLPRVLDARTRGAAVLVIEPIGRRTNLWWGTWSAAFTAAGGRDDDWRFPVPLPPRQRALAKAAGLSVSELTARSLYLPAPG